MSSLTGKEVQIVNALSSADLPESLIGESCVKELISAVVGAQQEASSAADRLHWARIVKANSNAISNWWNNSEDTVKDAQLRLTTTVANLNRHSSQLLIFNTAISKVLCDQQKVLLRQQEILEGQAEQLQQQNQEILEHQIKLKNQQEAIREANQGLMDAKGVTADQARKLVGCVQRVEATEERISEINRQLVTEIELRLSRVREEFCASQASAVSTLVESDKQLLKFVQDEQQKIESQSSLQRSLDERLSYLEGSFSQLIEASVSKHMAEVTQSVGELDQRIKEQVLQNSELRKGFFALVSVLIIATLGGAAYFLL